MPAKIFHADLYGTRRHKYETLLGSDIKNVQWQELAPSTPHYLFLPQEQAYREEYEAGWSVSAIFPVNNVGITTARDALTIQFTADEIKRVVQDFKSLPVETARDKYQLGPDARDWKVDLAQADLHASKGRHAPVLYRPFDIRHTYYTGISRGFHCMPRRELMRHMLAGRNLGLITTRMTKDAWDCLASNTLIGHKAMAAYDINYLFPLWIHPTETEAAMGIEREANIAPKFITEVKERIGETPAPEDIFHYTYAVFHAPTYRTRYAAFLKTDFPRLPLPPDAETFQALATLGAKLTALHLLEDPALQNHGIAFNTPGSHTVKKMKTVERYVSPPAPNNGGAGAGASDSAFPTPPLLGAGGPSSGRVKLNDDEYFENVPPEAWEFRVGGYQPAAKWLEDRAGRTLTTDDITHYRRMIAALRETAALLPQVDAVFIKMLVGSTEAADRQLKEGD